jgi:ribosomal protein S18 acetylase RimI-like enzyme
VLAWLRNQSAPFRAGLKVVVLSASTRESDRRKALELGADEYLAKPQDTAGLAGVVRSIRERFLSAPANGPVELRAERPEDEAFIYELYTSTRQAELNLTGWDAASRKSFLQLQFRAMRQGYASMFPKAESSVILFAGQSVGRLVVDRANRSIRVVDIAVLPQYQNRGIGTCLMRQVLAEAAVAGEPVRLQVASGNRALKFYERLSFHPVGKADVYQAMEWSPASEVPQAGSKAG